MRAVLIGAYNLPALFPFPIFPMKVVASKVKELINKKGMMCAGDLIEGLDKMLDEVLAKAAKRAEDNGRKTVRQCDL